MPPMLKDMPMLTPEELRIFDAFQLLSNSRTYSEGGPNAILVSEITGYAKTLGVHREDIPDWISVIQAMDITHCNHHRTEIKKEFDRIANK